MSEIDHVCKDCGSKALHSTDCAMIDAEEPCPDSRDGRHDWCSDDPLARLEARVMSTSGLMRIDCGGGDDWDWIDVGITDHDKVGMSEFLADEAHEEGFKMCGLGDSEGEVRFHRKKD